MGPIVHCNIRTHCAHDPATVPHSTACWLHPHIDCHTHTHTPDIGTVDTVTDITLIPDALDPVHCPHTHTWVQGSPVTPPPLLCPVECHTKAYLPPHCHQLVGCAGCYALLRHTYLLSRRRATGRQGTHTPAPCLLTPHHNRFLYLHTHAARAMGGFRASSRLRRHSTASQANVVALSHMGIGDSLARALRWRRWRAQRGTICLMRPLLTHRRWRDGHSHLAPLSSALPLRVITCSFINHHLTAHTAHSAFWAAPW